MQLPLSAAATERFEIREECGSTNTELVRLASGIDSEAWPDFSVLVTDNQTDGRGRLGRVWIAPAGQTLAISVLLRPRIAGGRPLGIEHYGWLPLIAGLAMTRAVATLVPSHSVRLKWPNDVQVDGAKVAGLLAELLPGANPTAGSAVVMGAGLNLNIPRAGLPTTTSTSLVLNDPVALGDELADRALAAYLVELRTLSSAFLESGGDPKSSGVHAQLDEVCSTLGQRVKVQLPDGNMLLGTATAIDDTGRLSVQTDDGVQAVAAGDVTHLRYE